MDRYSVAYKTDNPNVYILYTALRRTARSPCSLCDQISLISKSVFALCFFSLIFRLVRPTLQTTLAACQYKVAESCRIRRIELSRLARACEQNKRRHLEVDTPDGQPQNIVDVQRLG